MAYIKTVWLSGEIISAARLNKMEDGIYQNSLTPVITVDDEFNDTSGNPLENSVITNAFSDLTDDISEWGDLIQTLETNISELDTITDQLQDTIDLLDTDVETVKSNILTINNQLSTVNQNLNSLNNSIGTINGDIADLTNDKLDKTGLYEMFDVTDVTTSITVPANSYKSANSAVVSKPGYYPLGVVGFDIANTSTLPVKYSISAASVGSVQLFFGVRTTSTSQVTTNVMLKVLWVKVS